MNEINNFENVRRCYYCNKQINLKEKDTYGVNEFYKFVCSWCLNSGDDKNG